jgi:hypothetical protein
MKYPWLKEGVTTVMRGHSCPVPAELAKPVLSSFHGQPVLPDGGTGSSLNVGHCTA